MPTRKRKTDLLAGKHLSGLQPGEVWGYVRVSTDEQANSGLGIGAQIEKLKAQAQLKDWPEPIIVIDEGVSGTKPLQRREQFSVILKAIEERRVRALLVSSLDRIGRRALIIINFMEDIAKKDLIFVSTRESIDTATSMGQFLILILAGMAQLERDLIVSRTIDALAEKSRRDGDAGGKLPFGYRRVFAITDTKNGPAQKAVGVEIDSEAAIVVREIFRLRAITYHNRPMSMRKIIAHIVKIRQEGPEGRSWHASTIMDILANEDAYRGGLRGASSIRWPAILT